MHIGFKKIIKSKCLWNPWYSSQNFRKLQGKINQSRYQTYMFRIFDNPSFAVMKNALNKQITYLIGISGLELLKLSRWWLSVVDVQVLSSWSIYTQVCHASLSMRGCGQVVWWVGGLGGECNYWPRAMSLMLIGPYLPHCSCNEGHLQGRHLGHA